MGATPPPLESGIEESGKLGVRTMVVRVFRCRACGHRMRLYGDQCGACYALKKPYQKVGPLTAMLVIPAVAVLGAWMVI